MPTPYQDGKGIWHLTTKGQGYLASVERLPEILENRAPFTINGDGFHGTPFSALDPREEWQRGQLPGEYRLSLGFAIYVVYSWKTPIAWYIPSVGDSPAEWHIPPEYYTSTTSRYQGMIRNALRNREGSVIIP